MVQRSRVGQRWAEISRSSQLLLITRKKRNFAIVRNHLNSLGLTMAVRNLLILAAVVPLVSFLLVKFQDGDFTLLIYEKIGQDPAVALRGKVVWITGASSGIGEYLAYELVKYGCKLVLSARRKAELERVKDKCAGQLICDKEKSCKK